MQRINYEKKNPLLGYLCFASGRIIVAVRLQWSEQIRTAIAGLFCERGCHRGRAECHLDLAGCERDFRYYHGHSRFLHAYTDYQF